VDLTTRDERSVDTYPKGDDGCGGERQVHLWLPGGRLVTDGDGGLRLWDLETGKSLQLRPCQKQWATDSLLLASRDAGTIVRLDTAERTGQIATLSTFDIRSGTTRVITSHGNTMYSFALDASGTTLVTGTLDGAVRVGLLSGEEPHLLYGHTATVSSVAISPDGRWIASGSDDGTIRLWPMPDMSKPPLHTWPREELLAKLKSLTNLRAVRDPASDTGWKIEIGPFPGWKDVPEWNP
jgi:WD40 repeat protein